MDRLPPEITKQIAGLCDHASQKNLRLTCRTLESAVNELVFRECDLALFPHSVEKLRQISASPRLGQCVESVTLYLNIILVCEREQYDRACTLWRSNAAQHEAKEHERYMGLVEEQASWMQSCEGRDLVVAVLELPRLKSIRALWGCMCTSAHTVRILPLFKRLCKDMKLGPEEWLSLDTLEKENHHSTILDKRIFMDLTCILQALAIRSARSHGSITSLHLEIPATTRHNLRSLLEEFAIPRQDKFMVKDLETAFESLEELSIVEVDLERP